MKPQNPLHLIWLQNAIKAVGDGDTDKMSKDGWTVYRVKNIIRIDIKTTED